MVFATQRLIIVYIIKGNKSAGVLKIGKPKKFFFSFFRGRGWGRGVGGSEFQPSSV